METDPDRQYHHADLVRGYIARRGVQTFHVRPPASLGSADDETACGLDLDTLVGAGWARGLLRQGLRLCANCARVVDLDPQTDEDAPESPGSESAPSGSQDPSDAPEASGGGPE